MQSVGVCASSHLCKRRSMFARSIFASPSSQNTSSTPGIKAFTRPDHKPHFGMSRWSLKKNSKKIHPQQVSDHARSSMLRDTALPKSQLASPIKFCAPAFLSCPETLSLAQERAEREELPSDADSVQKYQTADRTTSPHSGVGLPCSVHARSSTEACKSSQEPESFASEMYHDALDYFEDDDMILPSSTAVTESQVLSVEEPSSKNDRDLYDRPLSSPYGVAAPRNSRGGISCKRDVLLSESLMPSSMSKGRTILKRLKLSQKSSKSDDKDRNKKKTQPSASRLFGGGCNEQKGQKGPLAEHMPHINSVYNIEDDEAIFNLFGGGSATEDDPVNIAIFALFGAVRDQNDSSTTVGRVEKTSPSSKKFRWFKQQSQKEVKTLRMR